MQRVVITGLGCLSPIGNSPEALWQSLELGRTGILPLPANDPTLKFSNAGQIPTLDLSALSPTQLQTTERSAQLAILAARQAAAEARLLAHYAPAKIAVILGCSTNGRAAEEPEIARVYTADARVHPFTIPRAMASNGTSQVSIDLGITGPAFTLSTACASGAHAIGLATNMIRAGQISAALAGAHEAPLTRAFLRAWDSMRVVSPTRCRPFSADRDGMSLAEGAAMLALESLESAQARHAPIFAEIVGFGMSSDAHHITQPRSGGAAEAMRAALADAAQTLNTDAPTLTEQVAYVNAHGTATRINDSTEAAALAEVFGPRLAHLPVSGTKGAHGHALGASSAIETLVTALALHHRCLPFTIGTSAADLALPPLDLIVGTPRPIPGTAPILALTNALAFGGLNAVLCLRSHESTSATIPLA